MTTCPYFDNPTFDILGAGLSAALSRLYNVQADFHVFIDILMQT